MKPSPQPQETKRQMAGQQGAPKSECDQKREHWQASLILMRSLTLQIISSFGSVPTEVERLNIC